MISRNADGDTYERPAPPRCSAPVVKLGNGAYARELYAEDLTGSSPPSSEPPSSEPPARTADALVGLSLMFLVIGLVAGGVIGFALGFSR